MSTFTQTAFTITDNSGTRSGAGWDLEPIFDQPHVDYYRPGDEEPLDLLCEPFGSAQEREQYVATVSPLLRQWGVPQAALEDVAALVCYAGIHFSYEQQYLAQLVLPAFGLDYESLDSEEWDMFLLDWVRDTIYKKLYL